MHEQPEGDPPAEASSLPPSRSDVPAGGRGEPSTGTLASVDAAASVPVPAPASLEGAVTVNVWATLHPPSLPSELTARTRQT